MIIRTIKINNIKKLVIGTMYNFSQTAVKLLRDYKVIIKKQFPGEEGEKKLSELQLDKRLPIKESGLYALLENIVEKTYEKEAEPESRLRYCGANRLVEHIKKVLDLHRLHNRKVVNSTQLASRAMIDAIQLMGMPKHKRSQEIVSKLRDCNVFVAQNGSEEQRKIFLNSLQSYAARDKEFFLPLLHHFSESVIDI